MRRFRDSSTKGRLGVDLFDLVSLQTFDIVT